jgi:hypothetical protein
MSIDEAKVRVERTIRFMLGKIAIAFLSMLLALGGYQLSTTKNLGEAQVDLQRQVTDLSAKLDDRYNDIKEKVEEHYRMVNERDSALAVTINQMSSALVTQNVELATIKQQLVSAKDQERIDIERTNAERERRGQEETYIPMPPPQAAPTLPLIGPLIQAISGKKHNFRRHGLR